MKVFSKIRKIKRQIIEKVQFVQILPHLDLDRKEAHNVFTTLPFVNRAPGYGWAFSVSHSKEWSTMTCQLESCPAGSSRVYFILRIMVFRRAFGVYFVIGLVVGYLLNFHWVVSAPSWWRGHAWEITAASHPRALSGETIARLDVTDTPPLDICVDIATCVEFSGLSRARCLTPKDWKVK